MRHILCAAIVAFSLASPALAQNAPPTPHDNPLAPILRGRCCWSTEDLVAARKLSSDAEGTDIFLLLQNASRHSPLIRDELKAWLVGPDATRRTFAADQLELFEDPTLIPLILDTLRTSKDPAVCRDLAKLIQNRTFMLDELPENKGAAQQWATIDTSNADRVLDQCRRMGITAEFDPAEASAELARRMPWLDGGNVSDLAGLKITVIGRACRWSPRAATIDAVVGTLSELPIGGVFPIELSRACLFNILSVLQRQIGPLEIPPDRFAEASPEQIRERIGEVNAWWARMKATSPAAWIADRLATRGYVLDGSHTNAQLAETVIRAIESGTPEEAAAAVTCLRLLRPDASSVLYPSAERMYEPSPARGGRDSRLGQAQQSIRAAAIEQVRAWSEGQSCCDKPSK